MGLLYRILAQKATVFTWRTSNPLSRGEGAPQGRVRNGGILLFRESIYKYGLFAFRSVTPHPSKIIDF